jgi:hypothetical protein
MSSLRPVTIRTQCPSEPPEGYRWERRCPRIDAPRTLWSKVACWLFHRGSCMWGYRESDHAWVEWCPLCRRVVVELFRGDLPG